MKGLIMLVLLGLVGWHLYNDPPSWFQKPSGRGTVNTTTADEREAAVKGMAGVNPE